MSNVTTVSTTEQREQMLLSLITHNPDMSIEILGMCLDNLIANNVGLFNVFNATNKGGANFISIKDYNSDVTNNTELASYTVNIGINYANMLNKDNITLQSYSAETIKDVLKDKATKHNYGKYDLKKFTNPLQPHLEIIDLLPAALLELTTPSTKVRENNNIKLNKSLWYNTNTQNFLVFGQCIDKKTTIIAEKKLVASAPMTVAKNIINDTLKKDDLRTFKLGNILTTLSGNKETIEIS